MKILYFARLRQIIGRGQDEIEVPESVKTVSALIDYLRGKDEGIAAACIGLYSPGWESARVPEAATARQKNTFEFVRAIRRAAVKYAPIEVYALTVVDQSLLQLGGLNFGSQFNKIRNPQDSCLLAALAARWYLSLQPSHASPVPNLSLQEGPS